MHFRNRNVSAPPVTPKVFSLDHGVSMQLPIQNCTFEFDCPRDYEKLSKTDDPDVRFCSECSCNVYRCKSLDELAEHSQSGRCVSLLLAPCTTDNTKDGDIVRITTGTFESFKATIQSVDHKNDLAEIMVHIFGRVTPFSVPLDTLVHDEQA